MGRREASAVSSSPGQGLGTCSLPTPPSGGSAGEHVSVGQQVRGSVGTAEGSYS